MPKLFRLGSLCLLILGLFGCTGEQAFDDLTEIAPTAVVAETSATSTQPPATSTQPPATTADADVTYVVATQQTNGTWSFNVTVAHPDTSWEDYADGWDVVLPDGTVVKVNEDDPFTRLLLHPHENEQPFTRSQSNLVIPDEITQVTVRAHDIVDGFGGQEVIVDLTVEQGENFEVSRP